MTIRIPQEELHFVALPAGATSPLILRSCTITPEQIALQEGNPPPIGNPGLKCTRTDTILKLFEFKMNFNIKINLNQDHMKFRSIQ
jgi:hypothetical protein